MAQELVIWKKEEIITKLCFATALLWQWVSSGTEEDMDS